MKQTSWGTVVLKKNQLLETGGQLRRNEKKGRNSKSWPTKGLKYCLVQQSAIDQLFADHGCTSKGNTGLALGYNIPSTKGVLHPDQQKFRIFMPNQQRIWCLWRRTERTGTCLKLVRREKWKALTVGWWRPGTGLMDKGMNHAPTYALQEQAVHN